MNRDEWLRVCGVERADALVLLREFAGVSRAALLAHPEAAPKAQPDAPRP